MSFDGSLVLGGISGPVFSKLDQNYITNRYFDEDTSGWSESFASILSRIADADAYGEYMGRINYSSDDEYVYWSQSLSESPYGRRFIGIVRLKASAQQDFVMEFANQDGSTFGATSFTATTEPQTFFISEINDQIDATCGYAVELRIYGSDGAGNADLYFDHAFLSEVLQRIDMPLPLTTGGEQQYLVFEKKVDGMNELWDGNVQEFGKKWRPNFFGQWDYLSRGNETKRQLISESDIIFCQPQGDIAWGFLGIWKNDFERRYAFGRFMGHRGQIMIMGVEYIVGSKPINKLTNPNVGVAVAYVGV